MIYNLIFLFQLLGINIINLTIEEILVYIFRILPLFSKNTLFFDIGTSGTGKTSTLKEFSIFPSLTYASFFGNKVTKEEGVINSEKTLLITIDDLINGFSQLDENLLAGIKTYSSGNTVSSLDDKCHNFPSIIFTLNIPDYKNNSLIKTPSVFSKSFFELNRHDSESFFERSFIIPSFLLRKFSQKFFSDSNIDKDKFLKKLLEARKKTINNLPHNISKFYENFSHREILKINSCYNFLSFLLDIPIDEKNEALLLEFKFIVDFFINISNFKYLSLSDSEDGKKLILKFLPFYLENTPFKNSFIEKCWLNENRVFLQIGTNLIKIALNIRGVEENIFEKSKLNFYNLEEYSNNIVLVQKDCLFESSENILNHFSIYNENLPFLIQGLFGKIDSLQKDLKLYDSLFNDIILFNLHGFLNTHTKEKYETNPKLFSLTEEILKEYPNSKIGLSPKNEKIIASIF